MDNHISAIISFAMEEIVDANKAGIRLVHAETELELSLKGIDDAKQSTSARIWTVVPMASD
jgi:hypothetical protein